MTEADLNVLMAMLVRGGLTAERTIRELVQQSPRPDRFAATLATVEAVEAALGERTFKMMVALSRSAKGADTTVADIGRARAALTDDERELVDVMLNVLRDADTYIALDAVGALQPTGRAH